MMNDNIKKYRKAKGMSQEEVAVRLNVVRQTVSKWENGLSVPDAEMLINMAELFNVPVSKLLGIEVKQSDTDNLTEELSRLNKLLAEKSQHEAIVKRADQKRGLILFFSFSSMLIALGVDNPVISLVLSGCCILVAMIILYRNLALLTRVTTDDLKLRVLRFTTIINIAVFLVCVIMSILIAADVIHLSAHNEDMFAMILITCVMIFVGIISPKLPFTRHTGLRLSWTVRDEDTWNIAHRVLGYISLPLALLYIACSLTISYFEQITLITMLVWIGIPGGISFIYFWKKHTVNDKFYIRLRYKNIEK